MIGLGALFTLEAVIGLAWPPWFSGWAPWTITPLNARALAGYFLLLGLLMLATARGFVAYSIAHPLWMLAFLVLISVAFSLLGFILGVWADGFEKLQVVPLMLVQPLAFLGGTFYSVHMLASPWQHIALFNPVLYLVSGFRWSFFGSADVGVGWSLGITLAFLLLCLGVVAWIFKTGYRLKA